VGSAQQVQDLQASAKRVMECFHASTSLMDDDGPLEDLSAMIRTVKLHHVMSHAADDILWHGHEQHYSAQVIIAQCLGGLA